MQSSSSFQLTTEPIYSPDEISDLFGDFQLIRTKKFNVYNVSCSFDIEVSSFYEGKEKRACMYCFVVGINGKTLIGRTWNQVLKIFNAISAEYKLDRNNRMIFFVHNLAYEFQFIRKLFKWEKVFAVKDRTPVQCLTDIGVEFRCSYLLTGYSLEKVGEHLQKYKVAKMVGDLDYSKIRTSETPMTEKELTYVQHDGLVVMAHIQEQIEQLGDISKIPLTKTGYVRRYCRNSCLYNDTNNHHREINKFNGYRYLMSSLTIDGEDEYAELKEAFQGGFTHASAFYSGELVRDVTSFDFTSSYPSVMINEMFPMSKGELIQLDTPERFKYCLSHYCCLFVCRFYDLDTKFAYEHIISLSKCRDLKNPIIDNGRIVSADELTTTITEQDFISIQKFYSFDRISVSKFRIYRKNYLPRNFVLSILNLYKNKTTLKGVESAETEYMNSKENLNSCYGMSVTDICRKEIEYSADNDWTESEPDYDSLIKKYNSSVGRFLFYPWGIWVTAYARRNLFSGIYEFKSDYVYSDTDSVKGRHAESHQRYIDAYNDMVIAKTKKALAYQDIPFELSQPKTIQGKVKPIGVWDFDGHYAKFKTLGAKRYMDTDDSGKLSLTISGVNKKTAVPYLLKLKKNPYTLFKEGLLFPKGACGKKLHTYIDDETYGEVTDYLGHTSTYHEMSSIHLEETEYRLSLADEYMDYLFGLREE